MTLQEQLQSVLGATYTVERELGGGGMSRVFVATETALGRTVVVKVVAPDSIKSRCEPTSPRGLSPAAPADRRPEAGARPF